MFLKIDITKNPPTVAQLAACQHKLYRRTGILAAVGAAIFSIGSLIIAVGRTPGDGLTELALMLLGLGFVIPWRGIFWMDNDLEPLIWLSGAEVPPVMDCPVVATYCAAVKMQGRPLIQAELTAIEAYTSSMGLIQAELAAFQAKGVRSHNWAPINEAKESKRARLKEDWPSIRKNNSGIGLGNGNCSTYMVQALQKVEAGDSISTGLKGRQIGNAFNTKLALIRRGLLTPKGALTKPGRDILRKARILRAEAAPNIVPKKTLKPVETRPGFYETNAVGKLVLVKERPLSAAGLAMLRNVAEGRLPTYGLTGRGSLGGAPTGKRALQRRGLLDDRDQITEAGRTELARYV